MSIPPEAPFRHLPLPEPFHVEWMLHHVRPSSYGAPYRFIEGRILRRPLRLAGIPAVAEFDLTGTGRLGVRLVSLSGQVARPGRRKTARLEKLVRQARFLWGLDEDATGHLAAMAADPRLAPLRKRFGGLRIGRRPASSTGRPGRRSPTKWP